VPAVADAMDTRALAGRLDGLLLTGSRSNVAGARYGKSDAADDSLDLDRDAVALELAGRMIEAGRPVFGICRGLQELNVLFGGTLTDALDDGHHRSTDDATAYETLFDHVHDVRLRSGGMLAAAIAEPSISFTAKVSIGWGRGSASRRMRFRTGWSRRSRRVHAAATCWRCSGIPNGTLQPAHPAAHSFHLSASRLGPIGTDDCDRSFGSHGDRRRAIH
jgi:hypothetical protein